MVTSNVFAIILLKLSFRPGRQAATMLRMTTTQSTSHPAAHSGRMLCWRAVFCSFLVTVCVGVHAAGPAPLRAGMIGLDTSHVPAFAKIFNRPNATGDIACVRISAGYPGGTDLPASHDRVGKFTAEVRGMGIEIIDSVPKLLEKVDGVLLGSGDGGVN